jgi:hypothetical protein
VRPTEHSRHAVNAVALFSIVIVRLPVLLGHPRILHPLIILLFLACIAWALPRSEHGITSAGLLTLALLYAAVIAVSLVRGSRAGVYHSQLSAITEGALYFALVGFAVSLITSRRSKGERDASLICLVLAPAVYASINLALYLAGVQSPDAGFSTLQYRTVGSPATLLGSLGVHTGRVLFPLASAINFYGVACGAALTGTAILMMRVRQAPRWPTRIGLGAAAACLLMGDSRTAIALSIAIILYFFLSRRAAGAAGAAVLLPALPLVLVGFLSILNSAGASTALSRNSVGTDFATATGRAQIWSASWDMLKHPQIQQLVGWGADGHITSGASYHWAYLFRGVLDDPSIASTHNLAIQTVFDSGYIGLAILIAAATMTCVRLARIVGREPSSPAAALLGMLLVILLGGVTEISPSYHAQEALVMTLLIMGASAGLSSTAVETYDAADPPIGTVGRET